MTNNISMENNNPYQSYSKDENGNNQKTIRDLNKQNN